MEPRYSWRGDSCRSCCVCKKVLWKWTGLFANHLLVVFLFDSLSHLCWLYLSLSLLCCLFSSPFHSFAVSLSIQQPLSFLFLLSCLGIWISHYSSPGSDCFSCHCCFVIWILFVISKPCDFTMFTCTCIVCGDFTKLMWWPSPLKSSDN